MSTSSNKIIQKPATVVDHNFFIPPGAVDLRHENDDDLQGAQDESNAGSVDQDQPVTVDYEIVPQEEILENSSTPSDTEGGGSLLPTPMSMTVVEQIYSVAEDGTASVDVIIDVPDMPGVTQIDARVTKV